MKRIEENLLKNKYLNKETKSKLIVRSKLKYYLNND